MELNHSVFNTFFILLTKTLIESCHKDKLFYRSKNGENQVEDSTTFVKIKSKDHTMGIVAICLSVTVHYLGIPHHL